MSRPPEPSEHLLPPWVTMAVTALVVAALTVGFVVVVLPQRFVLQGDLRASGVTFPTGILPSRPEDVDLRPAHVRPVRPPMGPAERFWAEVMPLLDTGLYEDALPHFRAYLSENPDDVSVRLELGITLVRAGRAAEAESVLADLLDTAADTRARIELTRLLAARGEVDGAATTLAPLRERAESDADLSVRDEVRRLSAEIADAREASAAEADRLAAESTGRTAAPTGADMDEAADSSATERAAERMAAAFEGDPLEAARRALAEDRIDEARALYESAVSRSPDDPDLLLEWADVLQYRLDDPGGALTVLLERARLVPPSSDDRFRLAQLYVWMGEEAAANGHLEAVVAAQPDHAGAWALLGDVRRWDGRRVAAGGAYGRALEIDPEQPVALAGRELLDADTRRAVVAVDSNRVGPAFTFFRDSDGFRRSEARAYGSVLPFPEVVELVAGYRRVEGYDLSGSGAVDDGGFFELSVGRWFREGTLRLSAMFGAEDSEVAGTATVVGAAAQARDVRGWNLGARYWRGPGHAVASTFESLAADVISEQLSLDAYRGLPGGLELSGALEGVRLRGGGDTVDRFAAGVAISRVMGGWFRTGVSSRYLEYDGDSPTVSGRRLYWDPVSFWSNGLLLEVRTPSDSGPLTAYARVTPGLARAHERVSDGPEWVRQLESGAGVRLRTGAFAITLDGFYTEGRAGDYTSRGLTLGLEVPR